MTTLFITHPSCLNHLVPPGHPERPARLQAIDQALEDEGFAYLTRLEAPLGQIEDAVLAHEESYVLALRDQAPREGMLFIDPDTVLSEGTFEAALRGVGAATLAIDEIMAGRAKNAFCATRPPGHHAERNQAMGFCFFNNAAVASRYARARHGLERVAIMDWDVHHGNGTQDIVWDDPKILYASTHEMPLYPGTGKANERGAHDTIVNVPLEAGADGTAFREAMERIVLPHIEAFQPELIVISAGFDAHWRDPLANLNFREEDFAWATQKLMALADQCARGRLLSVLEGGYDLTGLSLSVAAHVRALMEG